MNIAPLFQPAHETDCWALMRQHSLGLLLVVNPDGALVTEHLPVEIDEAERVLRTHLSRRHPLATSLESGCAVNVVFRSEAHYISPRFYVSGVESGRNAPSWNYIAVQVRAQAQWVDDDAWLRTHLQTLVQQQEQHRPQPWNLASMADAAHYQASASVLRGLSLRVTHIDGKWMMSQQRSSADRASIAARLSEPAQIATPYFLSQYRP